MPACGRQAVARKLDRASPVISLARFWSPSSRRQSDAPKGLCLSFLNSISAGNWDKQCQDPPEMLGTNTMSSPQSPATPFTPAQLQSAARALGSGGAGATQLLALLYDPDVEVDRVLASLKAEPALAARVLKVANSPFYRLSGSVGTLDRAVAVLGLSAIRGIAAAGCLDRLTPPAAGSGFDPDRFRLHSLAVACAAQGLSHASHAGIDGEAFMAGLLHDIGILLLVKAAPDRMARFVPMETDDPHAALADEERHLGANHELGAAVLAQAWQLPPWLHQAVATHHTAAAQPSKQLTGPDALPAVLALANRAAHEAGFGLWPICNLLAEPGAQACLDIGDEQWSKLVASLPATLQALGGANEA